MIEIVLISFNRLTSLASMVSRLEREKKCNISIVDNCSTYAPLIDYLHQTPHNVIFLRENLGHLSPWKSGYISTLNSTYHVVSDNDLDISGLPSGFLTYLEDLCKEFPNYYKIGLSLVTEDIPTYFPCSVMTRRWERQLCRTHRDHRLVDAGVDTTFAMYRTGERWDRDAFSNDFSHGVRTKSPYSCRHLPWYWNPATLTVEDVFYIESCSREISQGWTNFVREYMKEDSRYLQLKEEAKRLFRESH